MIDFLNGGGLADLRHLLLTAAIRSVPIALIGLAALLFARRRSGAVRHRLCLLTLAILLALPFATSIPQPHDLTAPNLAAVWSRVVGSSGVQATDKTTNAPTSEPRSVVDANSNPGDPSVTRLKGYPIPNLVWPIYLAGLLFLVVRQLASQWRLARLIAKSKPIAGAQKYLVLLSDEIQIPIALWWKRPMVILPSSSRGWPELRTRASIEHEVAHIARGDLAAVWLGFFVKLIYWPNPLVWVLAGQLSEAAESATDDRVLDSGIAAPDYAEMLVQTARERRSIFGPPVLAMARGSRVGRRVKAVLDPHRRRGGADIFVTSFCGLSLIAVTMLMGRLQGKTALPEAFSQDLKQGLTVPAQVSNGFVGEDVDGRKVTLLQIQRWTPNGVEIWKPDGTALPASRAISDDWHRHDPNELHLYSRFADPKGEVDLSGAGIGSGPSDPNDPPEAEFMGGYPVQSQGASKTIMSLLRIPTLNASRKTSVSFGYSSSSNKPVWTVYPNNRDRDGGEMDPSAYGDLPRDFGKRVKLAYPAYGTPFVLDSRGEAIKDGQGRFLHRRILSTELTYTQLSYGAGTMGVEPVAYRFKTGRVIPHVWNEGHQHGDFYGFSYYWPVSPAEIDHIDVNVHRDFHVAFLHFALRPNGAQLP